MEKKFTDGLFNGNDIQDEQILSLFRFQYGNNSVYRQWCQALHINASQVESIAKIPFLPISFFKTHKITCGDWEPELLFESSGTTQTTNSLHWIKEASLYERSFNAGFEIFYGKPHDWCIIGLLPAYLERKNSSLVKMAHDLITESGHPDSGFYLYDFEKLAVTLQALEEQGQPTLLIGVTFALLDFADKFPQKLRRTVVMETGGMKGRKKELTREEVHSFLEEKLGLPNIHSEYGMTELLSQAYSKGKGIYHCPPWMRILRRDENDPLTLSYDGQGLINVVDMANIYSCSFIATDDVGILYPDGSFEVRGRLDNSDIRGCSLLAI